MLGIIEQRPRENLYDGSEATPRAHSLATRLGHRGRGGGDGGGGGGGGGDERPAGWR